MPTEEFDTIHVLLAEDNQESYDMLAEYLESGPFRVTRAKDGKEAVRLSRTLRPDVILMDIQMPEMDGLEATRLLKADDELCRIPIVALTALALHGDRERCLEAGVDAYVSKPFSLRKVKSLIGSLIE